MSKSHKSVNAHLRLSYDIDDVRLFKALHGNVKAFLCEKHGLNVTVDVSVTSSVVKLDISSYKNKYVLLAADLLCNNLIEWFGSLRSGDIKTVEKLLKNSKTHNIDVNCGSKDGITPLMIACGHGGYKLNKLQRAKSNAQLAYILVKHGASKEFVDNKGYSAYSLVDEAEAGLANLVKPKDRSLWTKEAVPFNTSASRAPVTVDSPAKNLLDTSEKRNLDLDARQLKSVSSAKGSKGSKTSKLATKASKTSKTSKDSKVSKPPRSGVKSKPVPTGSKKKVKYLDVPNVSTPSASASVSVSSSCSLSSHSPLAATGATGPFHHHHARRESQLSEDSKLLLAVTKLNDLRYNGFEKSPNKNGLENGLESDHKRKKRASKASVYDSKRSRGSHEIGRNVNKIGKISKNSKNSRISSTHSSHGRSDTPVSIDNIIKKYSVSPQAMASHASNPAHTKYNYNNNNSSNNKKRKSSIHASFTNRVNSLKSSAKIDNKMDNNNINNNNNRHGLIERETSLSESVISNDESDFEEDISEESTSFSLPLPQVTQVSQVSQANSLKCMKNGNDSVIRSGEWTNKSLNCTRSNENNGSILNTETRDDDTFAQVGMRLKPTAKSDELRSTSKSRGARAVGGAGGAGGARGPRARKEKSLDGNESDDAKAYETTPPHAQQATLDAAVPRKGTLTDLFTMSPSALGLPQLTPKSQASVLQHMKTPSMSFVLDEEQGGKKKGSSRGKSEKK